MCAPMGMGGWNFPVDVPAVNHLGIILDPEIGTAKAGLAGEGTSVSLSLTSWV